MQQGSLFFSGKHLTNLPDCDIILALSGCGAVGSALPWGGRGRPFKSGHSDQAAKTPPQKSSCSSERELFVCCFIARTLTGSVFSVYNRMLHLAIFDRLCYNRAVRGSIDLKSAGKSISTEFAITYIAIFDRLCYNTFKSKTMKG